MAEASGLRILLAEDNETSRDIAVITLECKGAAVTAVENGQLCLDSFRDSEHYAFDAVLLDLRMPVMDLSLINIWYPCRPGSQRISCRRWSNT